MIILTIEQQLELFNQFNEILFQLFNKIYLINTLKKRISYQKFRYYRMISFVYLESIHH